MGHSKGLWHDALIDWLARLNAASAAGNAADLRALFERDSHWREVLALSWRIMTVSGRDAIVSQMSKALPEFLARDFQIDPHRMAPAVAERAGVTVLESIIRFETRIGRCAGLVRFRLDRQDGRLKAWTFHSTLESIRGHEEERLRASREEPVYERDWHGQNWLERRTAASRFDDREPAVLVVGGGHAGLAAAACLGQLHVDTLVVDSMPRIGDNWRHRYRALKLHNRFVSNHLPYMPFPPTWQSYLPKDRIANWLEMYADCMDINFWTSTSFQGARFDEISNRWEAHLKLSDGAERTVRPRHIIMATGVSGTPNVPYMAGQEKFQGPIVHTSEFRDGASWKGRNVLIMGTGTSAHDIAQELHGHGAHATLVQRSATLVVQIEPSAQLYDGVYLGEGPSLEDRDLINSSMPLPLSLATHRQLTQQAEEHDQPLLEGLAAIGFRLTDGVDGTGWPYLFRTRGGGYYFNVGCSDLLINGEVGLIHHDDIATLEGQGALMKSGEIVPADLIVLATGFMGHEHTAQQFFGSDVAARVGQIWGFDEDTQELRNMWMCTAQPGLFFTGGPFSLCRVYSKYLALQIKSIELGLNDRFPMNEKNMKLTKETSCTSSTYPNR